MSRDNRRSRGAFIPLLISLLIHLLGFFAFSLQALWPVRVDASKPKPFRVISVDLPKPKEVVPENPESRLLSDANRRASGEGKTGLTPQLREEKEAQVPKRRGLPEEQTASLAPAPPSRPAPPVQASPPKPAPKPPEPKKEEPKKPSPQVVRPPRPRPAPREEQAKVEMPKEEPPKPRPEKQVRKEEPKKKEPKKETPKPPRKAQRPAPQQDPLAMFRPQPKGSPKAPNLKFTDEDADRIARASLEKELKKEDVGDAISLDTRDFRFASYFAHIKERIQNNWSWPREARDYAGKLVLRFVLSEDGRLRKVELVSSSGYRILDDEAMSAIAKAAPFNPFPPGLGKKFLNIEGTFVYENSFRRVMP